MVEAERLRERTGPSSGFIQACQVATHSTGLLLPQWLARRQYPRVKREAARICGRGCTVAEMALAAAGGGPAGYSWSITILLMLPLCVIPGPQLPALSREPVHLG